MSKPKFDPNKPFTVVAAAKPKFDPQAPWRSVDPVITEHVDKLNPTQEMPEWLSTSDRLVAKNFAANPHKQVEFLKSKYPGKEFGINANKQVVARDPGQQWMVLDPDTGPISKDFAKDLGDIAYDIPAGIAQGAATTAAGAAGGMPGAMAASAGSGTALEAFRMKLGEALGIKDNMDTGNLATTAVISAASPAIFGAGKNAGTASRGAIERIYDGIPRVQSWATGVNREAIDYAKLNPQTMKDLRSTGITNTAQELSEKVTGYFDDQLTTKGKAVSEAMQNAGEKVNLEKVITTFDAKIAELKKLPQTGSVMQEIQELETLKNKYLKVGTEVLPSQVDAPVAFDLQQRLKQAARFNKDVTPEQASAMIPARNAYGALNDEFSKVTGGASQQAKDDYSQLLQLEKEVAPKFKDAQTTINTGTGLDKRGRVILKERLQQLEKDGKINTSEGIDKMNAYHEFYGPEKEKSGLAYLGALFGGAAGWGAGGGAYGSGIGSLAGYGAGKAAANRDLLLKAINAQNALEAAGRKIQPSVGVGAIANPTASQVIPWSLLKVEEE